jgi:hypothetical protein
MGDTVPKTANADTEHITDHRQHPPDVTEFLIADFESTREMRNAHNALVASEINIFVAMITVTFVALAFVSDSFRDVDQFLVIAILALIPVLLLGWAIFDRVARSRIQVVEYARMLNRTRRYFVDRFPEIERHVSGNIFDNVPDFGAVGRERPRMGALLANTGMIAILNSATVGAIVGMAFNRALDVESSAWLTIIVVAAFSVSLWVHGRSLKKRFDRAEDAWVSYFPKPES